MKQKKLVYINLDGFSYSYFEQFKENGGARGFCSLAKEGILFKNLRSGLVSITNPMQGAILSGAWSNKTHNFTNTMIGKQGKSSNTIVLLI